MNKIYQGVLASIVFAMTAATALAQPGNLDSWKTLAEGGAQVEIAQAAATPPLLDGQGTNALQITVTQTGQRFGIVCADMGGTKLNAGEWYDVAFNARTDTRKTYALIISLESLDGNLVCARTTLPEVGRNNWAHYTVALHIHQPALKCRMVIALADTGSIWLNDISVKLRETLGSSPAIRPVSQFALSSNSSPAISDGLNGSVTAANVAPYVRNAFVHDPSTLIKCKDEFWVFTTGRGVPSLHSKDLVNWERGPAIFTNAPPWVAEAVPANRGGNFWAPDVTYMNGRYFLYYSASSFGKCVSGIGLVTSPTLDPNDPTYGWTDQGMIFASTATDDFNAIDPAIFHDTNGSLWLTFGSFWSGIKMIQLDPQTGKRIAPDSELYSLAHYDSIEASYLYQHDGYYYLFVNWGMCCRGANSTYAIHVGRSKTVTGPYLDKDGKDMLYGGGTLFLDTTKPYIGPGHAGIIVDNGTNWFSCHYESGTDAGVTNGAAGQRRGSPLAVMPLRWTADNWPEVDLKSAD